MKYITTITIAILLSTGADRANAAKDYFPELVTLIATLANMAVEADNCEKQLTNFGKRGLESPDCKSFTKVYYSHWPDRDSLQDEILSYVLRSEAGEIDCDERCVNMLMRSEELRIIVVYTLDYMEFALDY